jgi:6-phosphogluconolactonase
VKEFLFVSYRKDNKITAYPLEKGLPLEGREFFLPGGPGPMAVNPRKDRLFAGLRDSFELACLSLSPDGGLEKKSVCSLPSDPCFTGTGNTGTVVFTAYYNAGQLAAHRLNPSDDSLTEIWRVSTEKRAHSLKPDRSGRWIFAPHTEPNKIYKYRFNADTGIPEPCTPAYISPPEYLQPRHLVFHPFLDILYVINEGSSTVSIYDFDPKTGGLAHRRALSTLPEGFRPENGYTENLCAEIRIRGDGAFLYASNRGRDSIAVFSVDNAGGCSIRGFVPAPETPRSFDLSHNGEYLYAAGQDSGELAVYRGDTKTGVLTEVSRRFTGNCPMWVMTVLFE